MTPRFGLLLALVFLLGGGIVLWLAPPQGQPAPSVPAQSQGADASAGNYVFAMSWQPGFCETRPDKPECRSQTPTRFDASHFTLHGLWPQNARYCGVTGSDQAADKAGRWFDLPDVPLAAATRAGLEKAMPGTLSGLDRHEWLKHGTCSGAPAEIYFGAALRILATLNGSAVRDLFSGRIGSALGLGDIRSAFDAGFGPGAGQRIRVSCAQDGDRRVITEITIGLSGKVLAATPLADLIAAAPTTDGGCDGGIVDPVGLQ